MISTDSLKMYPASITTCLIRLNFVVYFFYMSLFFKLFFKTRRDSLLPLPREIHGTRLSYIFDDRVVQS